LHGLRRTRDPRASIPEEDDFRAVLDAISKASLCVPIRLFASGLMSNHFHRVRGPRGDAQETGTSLILDVE
jgi:hypothetical protein